MKISVVTTILCLSLSAAFRLGPRAMIAIPRSVVATLTAITLAWAPYGPASAANYGGFGSTYAEVVNPKDAVLNESAASEDVKAGQAKLATLKQSLIDIKTSLLKDSQLDVLAKVKSSLNPGEIRSGLNKFNSAFAEDTQRGTDRLIRNVIQDVTSLEKEAKIKEGKTRSDTKVSVLVRRLDATIASLDELTRFLPSN